MANAAEKQVHWTRKLYNATLVEIGALSLTLLAAAIAAFAAVKAVNTARKSYSAEHRPWIKVSPKIIEPLTWDDRGNGKTVIEFELANIGNVPATNIIVVSKFFVGRPDRQFVIDEQKKMSAGAKRATTTGEIGDIFPDGKAYSGWGLQIREKEITEYAEWMGDKGIPGAVPHIHLVGVVQYTNASDGAHHQTGFCYTMRKTHPAGASGEIWIPQGENLPVNVLGLYQETLSPGAIY